MIILMYLLIIFGLFLLGAVFGSFAGAQVWRNRAVQLKEDKDAGEKVDKKEFKRLSPLLNKKLKKDRSRCLDCSHELAWYDLIPIISWLSLGGRCRYCKKFIGWSEIMLELALGGLFALSFVFWPSSLSEPLEVAKFILWLVAIVSMAVNLVYDMRWSLLLSKYNFILIGCGLIYAAITVIGSPDWIGSLVSIVASVSVLGGLYLLLWAVSRGRWVGEGDIYLGAGLALFLANWKVAFVALFAANLIGTIIILPAMVSGKLKRGTHVPFGPMLILGGILAWFVGPLIVDWYISLVLFV